MPGPNMELTGTVAPGQLAPPLALHVAVVLGVAQFSPALGWSLSATFVVASGPLFLAVRV